MISIWTCRHSRVDDQLPHRRQQGERQPGCGCVPAIPALPVDASGQECTVAFRFRLCYLSSGLRVTNAAPAATAPTTCASRYTHRVCQANMPITAAPRVTAGLNAPPEIVPTAATPAATVNPMA